MPGVLTDYLARKKDLEEHWDNEMTLDQQRYVSAVASHILKPTKARNAEYS